MLTIRRDQMAAFAEAMRRCTTPAAELAPRFVARLEALGLVAFGPEDAPRAEVEASFREVVAAARADGIATEDGLLGACALAAAFGDGFLDDPDARACLAAPGPDPARLAALRAYLANDSTEGAA